MSVKPNFCNSARAQYSANGLRQILPTQTNKIFLNMNAPNAYNRYFYNRFNILLNRYTSIPTYSCIAVTLVFNALKDGKKFDIFRFSCSSLYPMGAAIILTSVCLKECLKVYIVRGICQAFVTK